MLLAVSALLVVATTAADINPPHMLWFGRARGAAVMVEGFSRNVVAGGGGKIQTVVALGTGFVVGDGTLVVAATDDIGTKKNVVIVGGRRVVSKLVLFDDRTGFALLKVARPLPCTLRVIPTQPFVGETVFMIGRGQRGLDKRPTMGKVLDTELDRGKSLFEFSGPVSNRTGGALVLDSAGELVGLAAANVYLDDHDGLGLRTSFLLRDLAQEHRHAQEAARPGAASAIFDPQNTLELNASIVTHDSRVIERFIGQRTGAALKYKLFGSGLMHTAAEMDSVKIARLLLKAGMTADDDVPNSSSLLGMTPLWFAAVLDHPSMVEFLCQNGADVRKLLADKDYWKTLSPRVLAILKRYRAKGVGLKSRSPVAGRKLLGSARRIPALKFNNSTAYPAKTRSTMA